MTVLAIIQDVCLRAGIPAPNVAVQSTDPQVQQVLALFQQEGNELASRYPWVALNAFASWTADGSGTEGAVETLAPGYQDIVNNTFWDTSSRRPVIGPIDSAKWAQIKAQQWLGPFPNYRMVGGVIYTYPHASIGHVLSFEYRSKYWIRNATTGIEYPDNDSNTVLLDKDLLVLGSLWRWKAAKGFEYAQDHMNYERRLADKTSRDGGKQTLNAGGGRDYIQPAIVVPQGNWPL